jgi:hypothetical protein
MASGKAGKMACEPIKTIFLNHYFGQTAGH